MTDNLIQFAPIFSAIGAKMNFISANLSTEITDYPKGKKHLIDEAANEVSHFLDTKVYNDGLIAFALSDYIDGEPTAISHTTRSNILEGIGLTSDGKYIAQVLALLKSNKSWHTSEVPNTCSFFGEICTHRGIEDVAGKRGRKATRDPTEYHERKPNGIITREQLVTPALDAVHKAIPQDMLVSVTAKPRNIIRLDDISSMKPDELELILSKIREAQNATV